MHHDHEHDQDGDHDRGLAHDLATLAALPGLSGLTGLDAQQRQRRRALRVLLGAGTIGLFGCGGGGDAGSSTASADSSSTGSTGSSSTATGTTSGTTTTSTTTTGTTAATGSTSSSSSGTTSCTVIPEETAGPYPGDGSNASNGGIANALALSGIVRSDIRSSFAGASGTAGGVPLTVTLKLVNTNGSCADLSGYAIYLWHCDREGRYSMYSSGVTDQNYLRGVQETGSDGSVTFTTIFPACYSGRMPHIHFEVYRNANTATSWTNKLKTSQLALPVDVCSTVYNNASGYSASVSNLSRISFATDNVFSDGVTTQLAGVTGSVANGYTATLTVGIGV